MVMTRIATPALHALVLIVWQAWTQVLAAKSICQDVAYNDRLIWVLYLQG